MKTVYLSGGFRSGWQAKVKEACRDFKYKDPSKHGLSDPKLYTAWDLLAIRDSEIIFAYLERSNPNAYGLILEVGYAAALGKTILLVDEKSRSDDALCRQLKIVREVSNTTLDTLEEGILALQQEYLDDQ